MDQYIGDAYHDPIVECGRNVLRQLDEARKSDIIGENIASVTHILTTPDIHHGYWETITVHHGEIMGNISGDLLRQPDPPKYLLDMLGSLVMAHVYDENERYNRNIPLFSPDKTELAAHVETLWVMIPDRVREAADTDEYTLPIHKIGETTLELFKPSGQNEWSLNFTHQQKRVLMLDVHSPAQAWVEQAA